MAGEYQKMSRKEADWLSVIQSVVSRQLPYRYRCKPGECPHLNA